MSADRAETQHFAQYLAKIGSALDTFNRFEHPDALQRKDDWLNALNEPVPHTGAGIETVTELITNTLIPNGSVIAKPGFTSYITSSPATVATLAATAANMAAPQRYMLNAFNHLEELSLDWLGQMFELGDMKGVYSTGGSVANLVALGGARQACFERLGVDPAADGVDRPVRIYASDQCHHTIQRSAGVLGLGRHAVVSIASDSNGRLQITELKQKVLQDIKDGFLPMAIVGNAGTTNLGVIDPLKEIGLFAREHNIWFHIDGAYGLPGILDSRLRDRYQGLELADSVIVDPHKWLGASVGIAATFVHDRELLARAFMQEPADYLEGSVVSAEDAQYQHSLDSFGIPYFDYSVELSAPSRGVVVWAMLKEIGVEGLRHRICRHNDYATALAQLVIEHPQLELLAEPELSVCCFRFNSANVEDPDALNRQLHRQLIRENEHLPSTTVVNGAIALRPCFINVRTDDSHVPGLVEAVVRIGNELLHAQ